MRAGHVSGAAQLNAIEVVLPARRFATGDDHNVPGNHRRGDGWPVGHRLWIEAAARPEERAVARIVDRQVLGAPNQDGFFSSVLDHEGSRISIVAF